LCSLVVVVRPVGWPGSVLVGLLSASRLLILAVIVAMSGFLWKTKLKT
jgi:hypothetical protein